MIEQHRLRRQKPGKKSLKQYEFRLITKAGDIRNILVTIDMLPGTTRSVASHIDITERKETEAVMEQYSSEVTRYAEALTRNQR